MELFVRNLPYQADEAELSDAFASFGQVLKTTVVRDHDTGRSKGFGFVQFADDEAARRALAEMDGHPLGGRPIHVTEARPRGERPPPPPRPAPQARPPIHTAPRSAPPTAPTAPPPRQLAPPPRRPEPLPRRPEPSRGEHADSRGDWEHERDGDDRDSSKREPVPEDDDEKRRQRLQARRQHKGDRGKKKRRRFEDEAPPIHRMRQSGRHRPLAWGDVDDDADELFVDSP